MWISAWWSSRERASARGKCIGKHQMHTPAIAWRSTLFALRDRKNCAHSKLFCRRRARKKKNEARKKNDVLEMEKTKSKNRICHDGTRDRGPRNWVNNSHKLSFQEDVRTNVNCIAYLWIAKNRKNLVRRRKFRPTYELPYCVTCFAEHRMQQHDILLCGWCLFIPG